MAGFRDLLAAAKQNDLEFGVGGQRIERRLELGQEAEIEDVERRSGQLQRDAPAGTMDRERGRHDRVTAP